MNVGRLRETAAYILAHPERLDMFLFLTGGDAHRYPLNVNELEANTGACGCIAGLTHVLAEQVPHGIAKSFHTSGKELLGLTEEEAKRLFFVDDWPQPFCRDMYASYRGEGSHRDPGKLRDRAAITVSRIHHFIDKGE